MEPVMLREWDQFLPAQLCGLGKISPRHASTEVECGQQSRGRWSSVDRICHNLLR